MGGCNPGHMITYAYIESWLRFLSFILALPLYSHRCRFQIPNRTWSCSFGATAQCFCCRPWQAFRYLFGQAGNLQVSAKFWYACPDLVGPLGTGWSGSTDVWSADSFWQVIWGNLFLHQQGRYWAVSPLSPSLTRWHCVSQLAGIWAIARVNQVPEVQALDLRELWAVVESECEMLQVWGEEAVSENRSSRCPRRPSSRAPRRACRPLMKSLG